MTPPRRDRPQRLFAVCLSLAIVLAALAPSVSLPAPFARAEAQREEPVPSGDVIVVLAEDATRAEVRAEAVDEGVRPEVIFTEVIDAFTADVTQAEADALAADPDIAGVFPDSPVYAADELQNGVDRIDGETFPGADIDGADDVSVDVDVAILDSGIDAAHADLNVQPNGKNCQDTGSFDADDTGHGTHVAGIVGARDDGLDTVGVAPGARLHSVRVLKAPPVGSGGNSSGAGSISTLLCGLEWVILHADVIDVVNMSITGGASDDDLVDCGGGTTPFHDAVCAVVDAGIPVVVAAGNSAADAGNYFPATYPEVITVSAVNDADGAPGALGGIACRGDGDDRLANYSNVGSDVDIAAPGSCIVSSRAGGGTTSKSGTSMAAPHVTGAAALFRAADPGASPADVRAWLLSAASQPQNSLVGFTGDPDDSPEPILWLGASDQPTMTPSATSTPTPTPTTAPPAATPYPLSGGGRSPQSASYTYVRDGNLATSWKTKPMSSGPPAGAFVYTDLGSAKPIGTIRWIFGEYGYADVFRVEVSDDLAIWTQVTRRNGKPAGQWIEARLATPVTARYVRFFFENPKSDLLLGGLAEIQVWAPGQAPAFPTPTPMPTPTPVLGDGDAYLIVASDQSSNALDAGLAHDGNELTSWRTRYGIPTPAVAEARFQISSVQLIGSVRWVFNVGGRADAFTIDISDDGAFWETVFTGTNATSGVWQEVQLDSGATGKLVRWRFTNPNGDAALGSLAEVEIAPPLGGGARPEPATTATPSPTATPSASATPTATPATVATEPSTPSATPPAIDASPVAEGDTPTPPLTEIAVPTSDAASPTGSADIESPTTGPETPVSTPTETLTETPIGPSAEPITSTAEPTTTIAATTTSETTTSTPTDPAPTTENQEPRTDLVPVVGVRRSANSANGWTALDGDPATVWRTTAVPPGRLATITLALGEPVSVAALRILVAEEGFAGALTVEASDDLASWTYLAAPTASDLTAGEWATITFDAPATTRYLRLVVVNPADLDTLGGATEIEVVPDLP